MLLVIHLARSLVSHPRGTGVRSRDDDNNNGLRWKINAFLYTRTMLAANVCCTILKYCSLHSELQSRTRLVSWSLCITDRIITTYTRYCSSWTSCTWAVLNFLISSVRDGSQIIFSVYSSEGKSTADEIISAIKYTVPIMYIIHDVYMNEDISEISYYQYTFFISMVDVIIS